MPYAGKTSNSSLRQLPRKSAATLKIKSIAQQQNLAGALIASPMRKMFNAQDYLKRWTKMLRIETRGPSVDSTGR